MGELINTKADAEAMGLDYSETPPTKGAPDVADSTYAPVPPPTVVPAQESQGQDENGFYGNKGEFK